MSKTYTDIEDTLTSFAGAYAELKSLRNDLTTVLKGRLCVISDDELESLAKSLMGDADYIKSLSKAIGSRDAVSALRIYADTIRRLNESVVSSERIYDKLSERIKLAGDCPETTIAIRKRSSVGQNISIYKDRMKYCIERFYGLRKNVLARIARMSLAITVTLPKDNNRLRAIKCAPVCLDSLSNCDKYKGGE